MTDFAPWLRPTMFGPFVTMFAMTTLSHLAFGGAGDEVLLLGQRFDSWVMLLVLTGFIAAAIVVSLIFADIALLRMKLRRLPTGLGAWLSSMLAPFALWLAWRFVGDGGSTVLESALALVLPFPASALAIRLLLGRRP